MKLVPATIDQRLLIILIALLGIGVVSVFSASSLTALERTNDKFFIVKQQIRGVGFGLIAMLIFIAIDYRRLEAWVRPLFLGTMALLMLLLVPGFGVTVHGATRWVSFFGLFRFQPSEIAKLTVILFLASSLSRHYRRRESFWEYLLPNILALSIICLLVVLEKSLSATALVFITGILMISVAHANLLHLVFMGLVGLSTIVGLIFVEPYRLRRLTAFLDPWADPQGAGYHIIQSLMALGMGGVTGVGIGQSIQKLDYLPFQHTDFIFAVIGEEMGLLGSLLVISLFVAFFWRGIRISLRAPDLFGMFLAFGITSLIAVQAALHIAVVIGVVPTTGVPMPFISYGRSSLIMNLIAMGILLNISAAAERESLSRNTRRWSTP